MERKNKTGDLMDTLSLGREENADVFDVTKEYVTQLIQIKMELQERNHDIVT